MVNAPVIKPKKAIQKFKKLGFMKDRQSGSHIILYHPIMKKRAVIPLHVKDLPRGTLRAILNQTGISVEDFIKIK